MESHNDLKTSVEVGLSSKPKQLPSRFFYDAQGDALFVRIMHLPEYYLSRSELEIFQMQAKEMVTQFGRGMPFDMVELGAGDGTKTRFLLEAALSQSKDWVYRPVDISPHALAGLEAGLASLLPQLKVVPLASEYGQALADPALKSRGIPRLFLFLGSNLGNMEWQASLEFLKQIRALMLPQDGLLLGLDLSKDPEVIEAAYNDASGVTRAFNLNLLERINRELGANFSLDHFRHFALYEPKVREARSYLLSTKPQEVFVEALNRSFALDAWEPIQTEISKKYNSEDIEAIGVALGLQEVARYYDCKHWFANVLWLCPTQSQH